VSTGETAKADAKLSRGSTLKGRVVDSAGRPVDSASVLVVDAITGEAVGPWADAVNGSYEVPLTPRLVRITYRGNVASLAWRWYRNANDFDHATPVLIGNQDRTLDLVVPAS
jgi:hypothetical protein